MYQRLFESKIYSHLMFGMFERLFNWLGSTTQLPTIMDDSSDKVIIQIYGNRSLAFFECQTPDIENQLGPFDYHP